MGRIELGRGLVAVMLLALATACTGCGGQPAEDRVDRMGITPVADTPLPSPTPASKAGTVDRIAGIDVVWCPPGTFTMGASPGDADAVHYEVPHEVTITRGFWMSRTEVTKAEWSWVMGDAPWAGKPYTIEDGDSPAVYVTWFDVQSFLAQINEDYPESACRLPTEAEWEYACRAGTTSPVPFEGGDLAAHAWYDANAFSGGESYAHRGAMLEPNPWGLYDMLGNVTEWCQDVFGSYATGAVTDPTEPVEVSGPDNRVARGGQYEDPVPACRCSARGANVDSYSRYNIGFRLVCGIGREP